MNNLHKIPRFRGLQHYLSFPSYYHAQSSGFSKDTIEGLKAIEKKLIWLSSYMIHNANNVRVKRDGLKVGGHQSSSSSLSTIMTALYFHALQPHDRVAVKPHASPIFHAIQYLTGRQTVEKMQKFRSFGGVQSYPSRTKDTADVDFSTGSVGLGAAITSFSSLTQDYLISKGHEFAPVNYDERKRLGRMVAIVGDAELDEGNVFEVLLESWKHKIGNNWWIIDYNRQSLDKVVNEDFFRQIDRMFRGNGFNVVILKYGKKQLETFEKKGGKVLKKWIDNCDNSLYSVLTFKGGAAFRDQILKDSNNDQSLKELLSTLDDTQLYEIMTNLGGHDTETILEAFRHADDNKPTCFIAYTVKGYGLPLAGHRDNHGGFLNQQQMDILQSSLKISKGKEWSPIEGMSERNQALMKEIIAKAPFYSTNNRCFKEDPLPVPSKLEFKKEKIMSTQEVFGKIMLELGKSKSKFASRVVTTAPDVATSTNLGGWVNQRGVFGSNVQKDTFRENKVISIQKWEVGPKGQHIELGIAENNMFLLLAALGLSEPLFGRRLIPVGTLYDPFIARGLDSLNYGCYQNSRFMLVATPSGISLAPEGGAHQSINTPLIAIGQPGLISYEPAYGDELAVLMKHGFEVMQQENGSSIYFRLSTRPIPQIEREISPTLEKDIIAGAYWASPVSKKTKIVIIYCGTVAPEAIQGLNQLLEQRGNEVSLMAVTSPQVLYQDWQENENESHISQLLEDVQQNTKIVTVHDAHPASLSWIGGVKGMMTKSLGVTKFGQSGDIIDLYKHYRIDSDAILEEVSKFQ